MTDEYAVEQSFRQAMRRIAASVSVITGLVDGRRCGIAATAVTSLTMGPPAPALLVCVNRSTRLHAALKIGAPFCVNLLAAHHLEVSQAFGGSIACDDRFVYGNWRDNGSGVPYLEDARANVFCTVDLMTGYGTHSIVVGRVAAVHVGGELAPLIYENGRYR